MGIDVVSAGIIVVDHVAAPVPALPEAGRLVLTDECFLSIGGCASNAAVDLAKMGVRVAICGCVGADPFGQFARDYLATHGVDTSLVTTVPNVATSQTLILNVQGQDRRFVHHLGANRVFTGDHFPKDLIRQAKILYVGGYFLMDSLTPGALAEVFRFCRQQGVKTVMDVVTPGPKDYLEALAIVLPFTDVFLPNNDEGELMTGLRDPVEQAELFRKLGAETVVVTCGGKGAVLLSEKDRLRSGVYSVPFVDGTGGGDAFDAGFICGLLWDLPIGRRLELGSALGASCVRRSGATDGVFNRQEAEAFLAQNRLTITPL